MQRVHCRFCGEGIPSDEQEGMLHLIFEHKVPYGPYLKNIARIVFADLSKVKVKDLETFNIFQDGEMEEINFLSRLNVFVEGHKDESQRPGS